MGAGERDGAGAGAAGDERLRIAALADSRMCPSRLGFEIIVRVTRGRRPAARLASMCC